VSLDIDFWADMVELAYDNAQEKERQERYEQAEANLLSNGSPRLKFLRHLGLRRSCELQENRCARTGVQDFVGNHSETLTSLTLILYVEFEFQKSEYLDLILSL
jgi:hypothetical protein